METNLATDEPYLAEWTAEGWAALILKPLKAPYPYFGGKSRIAALAWSRIGDVRNYIEPFFGSGAMLLLRPHPPAIETVNDLDCMVPNFWRAINADPDAVADHCNWPVCESDLHARHRYLVLSDDAAAFRERMRTDPHYFDPMIAGWWVWGICQWIGGGWCRHDDGTGRRPFLSHAGQGVLKQQMPDCSADSHGRGVHKKRPALANERGVTGSNLYEKKPKLSSNGIGCGVHRMREQLPDLSGDSGAASRGVHGSGMSAGRPQLADQFSRGRGVHSHDEAETVDARRDWLRSWFRQLQNRMRSVRVCCGDWSRVCGSRSVTTRIGITGVFLDPPYLGDVGGKKSRDDKLYASESLTVAHDCRKWCIEHGDDPDFRIALCGLDGEHNELESRGWDVVAWKANGGYGNRNEDNQNADRERIWFSPHCLKPQAERTLF